ncbi:unnamed protein product [Allacma fusca]|uniref:Uncharacterized protein n=1 Tax=Allacma fusca TaxID=39272 RepID=A0A8J2K147_9HEXA|nr:unnamed protein product [Allacma fusca]
MCVDRLNKGEVEILLLRTFGLHVCLEYVDRELHTLLQEFESIFHLYILALWHAAVTIMRKISWTPDQSRSDHYQIIVPEFGRLKTGINWYMRRFEDPNGEKVLDFASEYLCNNYEHIMDNVWSITLNKSRVYEWSCSTETGVQPNQGICYLKAMQNVAASRSQDFTKDDHIRMKFGMFYTSYRQNSDLRDLFDFFEQMKSVTIDEIEDTNLLVKGSTV